MQNKNKFAQFNTADFLRTRQGTDSGRVHEDDLDWQGVNAALCKVAVTDPSAGVWCIALIGSSSCPFVTDSRASLAEQAFWALEGGFVQAHLWLRLGPEAGSEDPSGLGELVCESCWDKCEPASHCWVLVGIYPKQWLTRRILGEELDSLGVNFSIQQPSKEEELLQSTDLPHYSGLCCKSDRF